MARALRIEYPGAYYHVINRGNAGQAVFKSKRDREKFLEYLATMVDRYALRLHCYCLMTNHYHLLIQTPEANLSRSIHWLNASYAMYFNTKRGRHGHLFQGRFKSILIDADEYFKHLSRYIHLNPIRVNMVEHLADYPWSSYRAFIGKEQSPQWLDTEYILEWFGKRRKHAQRTYQDFVETFDSNNEKNPSEDIVGGMMLGRPEFIDWVKSTFLSKRENESEISGLRYLQVRDTVEDVVKRVSDHFEIPVERILCKGIKKNLARDIAMFIARQTTGESVVGLGGYFGGVRGQAVTNRCNKVKELMVADRRIRRDVNRLLNNE